MATYFHGNSELQASADNGLQTLILMNPSYIGFSDTHQNQHQHVQAPNNFFLSPTNPHVPPQQQPPHTQQFVGISLPPTTNSTGFHDISALHRLIPRSHHNLLSPTINQSAARETPRATQGLSLSLSNSKQQTIGGEEAISGKPASPASTGPVSGIQSVLLSSKYLNAAQQLLEECANVGNGGVSKSDGSKKTSIHKEVGESSEARDGETRGKRAGMELSTAERQEVQMKKAKLIVMLDEVEQRYRQYHHQMQIVITSFEQAAGIDSAKTYTALALKTISKQFRCLKDSILNQIQTANKSLGEEDIHGEKLDGSRLKFVDNQFRQQRALQQLGMIQHNAWRPQRGLPERSVSVLRAWLFEHFLHPYPKDSDKHMLAKQTGLTRSQVSNWFINARVRLWKPMVEEMYLEEVKEQEQNGSEDKTSKSEHIEDSASKSEEKRHFTDNIQSKSFKTVQDNSNSRNGTTISTSVVSASPVAMNARNQSSFNLIGSSELEGITQSSPKKQRNNNEMLHFTSSMPSINMDIKSNEANNDNVLMKFGIERQGRDGYSIMGGEPANFTGGFGSFPIGAIGRFDNEQFQPRFLGNSVSLTLGLPDRENLSMSGSHQSFLNGQNIQLGRRVDMEETDDFGSIHTQTPTHSTTAYDIQNQKRFAAQLLPDFVA